LRQALAFLVMAGFAAHPLALRAQELPDALKDKALVVHVTVIVPAAAAESGAASQDLGQPWEAQSTKYTVPGTPAPFKLVGSNIAVIVQITPFERDDGKGVTLIAQGQVWVKPPEGGLSYHTTIESLSVDYGETVLFFPLGLDADGGAPIRLEISVARSADAAPDGGAAGDKSGK
jgi:hypothetical protein